MSYCRAETAVWPPLTSGPARATGKSRVDSRGVHCVTPPWLRQQEGVRRATPLPRTKALSDSFSTQALL